MAGGRSGPSIFGNPPQLLSMCKSKTPGSGTPLPFLSCNVFCPLPNHLHDPALPDRSTAAPTKKETQCGLWIPSRGAQGVGWRQRCAGSVPSAISGGLRPTQRGGQARCVCAALSGISSNISAGLMDTSAVIYSETCQAHSLD